MLKYFSKWFLIFISFMGIFSVTSSINIPNITLGLVVLFSLLKGKIHINYISKILILMLTFSFFKILLDKNMTIPNQFVNDIKALITLIILTIGFANVYKILGKKLFFKYLYYGVFICISYGYAYILMKLFFNIDLDNYIPRYAVEINRGSIADLSRARSTFTEPKEFAFFISLFLSISLLKKRRNRIFLFLSLFLLILSFSLTTYIAIIVSLSISISLKEGLTKKIKYFVIFIISIFIINTYFEDNFYYNKIIDKVKISKSKETGRDESKRFRIAINEIKSMSVNDLFLGKGIGFFREKYGGSIGNFYLEILIENGVLIFILWISLLCLLLKKINSKTKSNNYENLILNFIFFNILITMINFSSRGIILPYYALIFLDYFSGRRNDKDNSHNNRLK